jgi:hypothetical protein
MHSAATATRDIIRQSARPSSHDHGVRDEYLFGDLFSSIAEGTLRVTLRSGRYVCRARLLASLVVPQAANRCSWRLDWLTSYLGS